MPVTAGDEVRRAPASRPKNPCSKREEEGSCGVLRCRSELTGEAGVE